MMAKTLTQILAERPEIAKRIYDKYPESKREIECANEKREMDLLRWGMAKKLYDGTYEAAKKEYESKVEKINDRHNRTY